MHNGTVSLESAVGEGSTLTVSIPDDIPLIDAADEKATNVNARDEEPREGHVGEETHG